MFNPAATTIDSVLDRYSQLMRSLHAERARRGFDPWYACPLTVPQLRALSLIATHERGLSSRELAATLGVGPSAITPLVDRLVERGYVTRQEDLHDRRIARLLATPGGAAILERMYAVQRELMRDILAQIDPTQLESVGTALDVLREGVYRVSDAARYVPEAQAQASIA